jgi:hypothetical protein
MDSGAVERHTREYGYWCSREPHRGVWILVQYRHTGDYGFWSSREMHRGLWILDQERDAPGSMDSGAVERCTRDD